MQKLTIMLICLGLLTPAYAQSQQTNFFEKANIFFGRYVDGGLVDYAGIKSQSQDLQELLTLIANYDLQKASEIEIKTFQINTYNILVIKGIVDHYPVASPLTVAGFFDGQKYQVAGEMLTLNDLEKKRLLPQTQDPRLHLVLVCAALGCPALADFAYTPTLLEEQLQNRTSLLINDPDFVRIREDKVELSKIFKWYRQDFESAGGLIPFINGYRSMPLDEDISVGFYHYDWSLNQQAPSIESSDAEFLSNVQRFTPSALLGHRQWEFNLLNNFYTQDAIRNAEGQSFTLNGRQSFLTQTLQISYGASPANRLNLGLEVNFNHAWYSGPQSFSRSVIASVGPRLKVQPLAKVPRLSFQSTFLIPVSSDLESPLFVAHDRYTWNNQLFFDQNLGSDFQVFLEAGFLYRIARNSQQDNFFRTPLTAIISYFPIPRGTLFILGQYAPRFGTLRLQEQSDFGKIGYFTQLGLGAKYQLTPSLQIEGSYTNFVDSKRDGAGSTFNLGLRFIK